MVHEKRKCFWLGLMATTLIVGSGGYFANGHFSGSSIQDSEIRTVTYDYGVVLDQSFLSNFEEHDLREDETGIEFVAKKSFDSSVFEGLDFVGLDEDDDSFVVRYEVNYLSATDTVEMTVILEGATETPILETIYGVISHNDAGQPDIMFVVDENIVWLSDLQESGPINSVGLFSWLVKAVATVVQIIVEIITVVTRRILTQFGVIALDMYEAPKGSAVYHAKFDGWQAIFGYNDFFDKVFDWATDIDFGKFDFYDVKKSGEDSKNRKKDYVLWAWKADYLNLGAGAELGVYERLGNTEHWVVNKNLNMKMTLQLHHKGTRIIDWAPEDGQWWITGFNTKSQYWGAKAKDLKATITVDFTTLNASKSGLGITNSAFYEQFRSEWRLRDARWNFDTYMKPRLVL